MNMKKTARMERGVSGTWRRKTLPLLLAGCLTNWSAYANPTGQQIVNGQATFTNQNGVLSIVNTPGAIINWQNFSIDAGETTRFLQQSASSAVLNRILGQDPSRILGALQSNGKVFLINPNGILFGQGSRVDVNGLVASTLNITNEDFVAGRLNFKAGDKAGDIKNQGAITTPAGGQVYLIASNVENSGIITSPKGDVVLAAGHSVQLVDSADPNMQVVVSAPEHEALNLGQVVAHGGRIGIFGALVNQRGLVSADSAVVGENGKIVFKASGTTILDAGSVTTATGVGKGGEIDALGDRVGLVGDAKIDVSGNTGGGTVLVGGDYQGKNPDVRNARRAFLGQNAEIKADALESGDGGKVIVWSMDDTRAYGNVLARGGRNGGNGGFTEISGKEHLDFRGDVDLRAPKGAAGTLLLDPNDITIQVNGPDTVTNVDILGLTGPFIDDGGNSAASPSVLTIGSLQTQLGRGNVTVSTSTGTNGTGIITIADPLSWAQSTTLTLNADASIAVNAAVSPGANATLNLNAQTTIDINGAISGGALSAININAGGDLNVNSSIKTVGGNITLTSGGTLMADCSPCSIDAINGAVTPGNVTMTSTGTGSLSAGIQVYSGSDILANKLSLSAAEGILLDTGTNVQANSISAQNSGSGDIQINITGHDLIIGDTGIQNNNGYVSLSDDAASAITVSAPITAKSVSMTTGTGLVTINANITATGTAVDGFGKPTEGVSVGPAGGGSVTINAGKSVSSAGYVSMTMADITNNGTLSGLEVDLHASNNFTNAGTGSIGATGNGIMIDAGNDLTNAGSISATGGVDLTSTAGTLTNSGTISASGGSSSGMITLTADNIALGSTANSITANGGTGMVEITTSKPVDLGTANDVVGTLGLSDSELKTVKAGNLRIITSDATGSAINMSSALTATNAPVWGLYATNGGITQSAGATLPALNGLAVSGTSITLPEANNVGAVAGSASAGDFVFTTTKPMIIGFIDSESGVRLLQAGHNIKLKTDSTISQATLPPFVDASQPAISTDGGGLVVEAGGNVLLTNTSNFIDNVAASMNTGGGATAATLSAIYSATDLNITTLTGASGANVPGIATNNGSILLTAAGINGAVTLASSIAAGTGAVQFVADGLSIGNVTVNAGAVSIQPHEKTRPITVGANVCNATDINGGCLTVTNLFSVNAPTIAIGTTDTLYTGDIYVAGITSGGTGLTDRSATTTQIALLGGGGASAVTQGAVIDVPALLVKTTNGGSVTLNAANTVTSTLAAATSGGAFNFKNAGNLTIGSVSGLVGTTSYNLSGVDAGATGPVTLVSTTGSVNGGTVIGGTVNLTASTGISLTTQTTSLTALNTTSGDIGITNTGAVTTLNVSQDPANPAGGISISNYGALTVGAGNIVSTINGPITLTAHSPLTVNGTVSSTTGAITLVAGSTGQATDILTINAGAMVSTGGSVTLNAGAGVNYAPGTVSPTPTVNANQNTPPGPTLTDCIANPTLAGCSTVLPTLTQCTADPTLAGCSVVLPTLAQCTADPTLAGCAVVLPALSQCTADPTLAGCTAVLPTVSQCTANSSLAGCSVVLPTLTQCIATPTLSGCSVVLPTLTQCIATPTLSGCSVVLPTLTQCIATPTLSGCSVVLPTLTQCIATPTLSGCSVVLPTLTQCIATPTLSGCSVVLPTLTQCIATPSLAGCSIVLPAITQCTVNPAQAGCSVVLPTLAQCIAIPSLAGCSAVLPTLTQCVASPTLQGCSVVLPAVSTCVTTPTMAGCNAVLPTASTQENTPVTQTINSTINLINTTIVPTGLPVIPGGVAPKSPTSTSSTSSSTSSKDDKKTDTVATNDSGVKKNDAPANKMYCN
jgi:filamentous hemagglutinin family protein